jgi:tetratricopeptide (TPR) repeat protein
MEHQQWGAASACVAGTALFIAGRNALSARGEQKTHEQIEKRLLRALQDGQTDLLTAINTVAAEHDMHDLVSQRRVKRLAKLLTARADELAKATADTARILDAIGRKLDEQCQQHNQTLDSVTDDLKRWAAQSHAEHQRHERRSRKDHRRLERKANAIERDVKELVKRVTPPAIQPLHQLRPPLKDFTGRQPEIDDLLAHIQQGVTITGVQGMGGIGKTELAYVLADRVKEAYPDAQLCLELKGTSPSPLSPAEVLAYIIHRFHPAEKLPDDVAEFTKLYHSTLHGQRVLLLMDNAADADQLRPLCPPPDGSVLLVTSRQHFILPGLHAKNLDALPPDKACDLLRTICPRLAADVTPPPAAHVASPPRGRRRAPVALAPRGRRRAPQTPPGATDLVAELAQLCGCLPLALRVTASALAERVTLTPADYITRLKNEQRRLKELDPVIASLASSDAVLPADLRPRWYALAVFPADFDLAAAAAVWDMKPDDAQDALDALHRYSVLEWNAQTRRFHLHDLLRLFARERLPATQRQTTESRHSAHFEAILSIAKELYKKDADGIAAGLALFDLERHNILAGQTWAATHSQGDDRAARLASAYPNAGVYVLDLRLHPQTRITWLQMALAAARVRKDRAAEGAHVGNLGKAYGDLGHLRKATPYHEQALAIARETGDRRAEGAAVASLGGAYHALGETRKAIDYYEQALVIARDLGDRRAGATPLNNLGLAYAALGQTRKAIEYYELSLALAREVGDHCAEAQTLGNLGLVYADLGQTRKAVQHYEQALTTARQLGDQRGEGAALGNLGAAHRDSGEPRKAIEHFEQQLDIARETADRRSEGDALGGLGTAYADLGDPRKAIEYHEQHLAITREIGNRRAEGAALGNLANAHADLGEPSKAIAYYEQVLAIARETADRRAEGNTLGNLGLAYAALGEARRAIEFYEQRLVIAREIGDRRGEGHALGGLGIAHADLDQPPKAIEYYEQHLAIAREIGDRQGEALTCWNMGDEYAKAGDLARAIELMQVRVDYEREIAHPDAEKHAARVAALRARLK